MTIGLAALFVPESISGIAQRLAPAQMSSMQMMHQAEQ
jgi:hypothetical protein